jgi:hypothetical protein
MMAAKNMNSTKPTRPKANLFALWRDCRELLTSRPAPSIWFDPRPNRRIRLNLLRCSNPLRRSWRL